VEANIARLGALGLEVHITEMDVRCAPDKSGAICGADRLAAQAQIYGGILGACLKNANCKSFEFWGFTDRHTWLCAWAARG
jgi:endo-1,4-beta-xylanase